MRFFFKKKFRWFAQRLINIGIGEVHNRLLCMSLSEGIDYIQRLKQHPEEHAYIARSDMRFLENNDLMDVSYYRK